MLVAIIILALFIGILFLAAAISLGGYFYNKSKGNSDLQKKCMKIFIPSAIVWFLFVMVNTILIAVFLYNNREGILAALRGLLGS